MGLKPERWWTYTYFNFSYFIVWLKPCLDRTGITRQTELSPHVCVLWGAFTLIYWHYLLDMMSRLLILACLFLSNHIRNTVKSWFANFLHVFEAQIHICSSFKWSKRCFIAALFPQAFSAMHFKCQYCQFHSTAVYCCSYIMSWSNFLLQMFYIYNP